MIKSKAGFTLVEMLVVIALLSIVLALTLPRADEWWKIRRVQDSALRFASTLERLKVTAARYQRPFIVAKVDQNHYAVYNFNGTLAPRIYQPDTSTSYYGSSISNPWGGGANVPNPMPSRVSMSTWSGIFSGGSINAFIIMSDGTFRRFTAGAFTPGTSPLGDIFRISFTDDIIQAGGDTNMKEITSWRVDVEPAGNVAVKKLHAKED